MINKPSFEKNTSNMHIEIYMRMDVLLLDILEYQTVSHLIQFQIIEHYSYGMYRIKHNIYPLYFLTWFGMSYMTGTHSKLEQKGYYNSIRGK